MNLLNVILSVCITGIMSYFTILNISKLQIKKSDFLIYNMFFIPLVILNCLTFEGMTRLILTIIFTIMALYLSVFKKDISNSVYYTLSYELLAYISEIIISVIFVLIFRINLNSYDKFRFSLLLFSISNCLLVYVFSKIKILNKNIRRLNLIISKKS